MAAASLTRTSSGSRTAGDGACRAHHGLHPCARMVHCHVLAQYQLSALQQGAPAGGHASSAPVSQGHNLVSRNAHASVEVQLAQQLGVGLPVVRSLAARQPQLMARTPLEQLVRQLKGLQHGLNLDATSVVNMVSRQPAVLAGVPTALAGQVRMAAHALGVSHPMLLPLVARQPELLELPAARLASRALQLAALLGLAQPARRASGLEPAPPLNHAQRQPHTQLHSRQGGWKQHEDDILVSRSEAATGLAGWVLPTKLPPSAPASQSQQDAPRPQQANRPPESLWLQRLQEHGPFPGVAAAMAAAGGRGANRAASVSKASSNSNEALQATVSSPAQPELQSHTPFPVQPTVQQLQEAVHNLQPSPQLTDDASLAPEQAAIRPFPTVSPSRLELSDTFGLRQGHSLKYSPAPPSPPGPLLSPPLRPSRPIAQGPPVPPTRPPPTEITSASLLMLRPSHHTPSQADLGKAPAQQFGSTEALQVAVSRPPASPQPVDSGSGTMSGTTQRGAVSQLPRPGTGTESLVQHAMLAGLQVLTRLPGHELAELVALPPPTVRQRLLALEDLLGGGAPADTAALVAHCPSLLVQPLATTLASYRMVCEVLRSLPPAKRAAVLRRCPSLLARSASTLSASAAGLRSALHWSPAQLAKRVAAQPAILKWEPQALDMKLAEVGEALGGSHFGMPDEGDHNQGRSQSATEDGGQIGGRMLTREEGAGSARQRWSDADVARAVRTSPSLLSNGAQGLAMKRTALAKALFIEESDPQFTQLLAAQPDLLTSSPATLVKKLQVLGAGLGLSRPSVRALALGTPRLLSMGPASIMARVAWLQRLTSLDVQEIVTEASHLAEHRDGIMPVPMRMGTNESHLHERGEVRSPGVVWKGLSMSETVGLACAHPVLLVMPWGEIVARLQELRYRLQASKAQVGRLVAVWPECLSGPATAAQVAGGMQLLGRRLAVALAKQQGWQLPHRAEPIWEGRDRLHVHEALALAYEQPQLVQAAVAAFQRRSAALTVDRHDEAG